MTLIDPITEVWNGSRSTGTERVVLLAIAKYADADGYAWPGLKRLTGMANVGERATQAALAKLVLSGELAVLRGQGRGHASLYRVLLGQPEGAGEHEAMLAWLRSKTTPYLADLYAKVNRATPSADRRKVSSASPSGGEKVQPTAKEKVQHPSDSPAAYRNELPEEKEEGGRPEIGRLCNLLAERIIANVGARKKYEARAKSKAWQDACRLLLDDDDKRPDQVERAIYYATGHEFWCSVVLSMGKLRAKYDQMSLQAARERGNGSGFRPTPPPKPPEPHQDHEFGAPCRTYCKHRNCPLECGECAAQARPDLKVVSG